MKFGTRRSGSETRESGTRIASWRSVQPRFKPHACMHARASAIAPANSAISSARSYMSQLSCIKDTVSLASCIMPAILLGGAH